MKFRLKLGGFLLGTFACELSLGSFRVRTFALELLNGNFCLDSLEGDLRLWELGVFVFPTNGGGATEEVTLDIRIARRQGYLSQGT